MACSILLDDYAVSAKITQHNDGAHDRPDLFLIRSGERIFMPK